MELTECEKCVLEHIFLSQPASKEVINTADAFARILGHSWTEEEISHALASLTSRQFIIEVTSEIAMSILKGLRGVHGPLVPISMASHYSVTPAGGRARLAYCPLNDPLGFGGRGVVLVEHSQFFTAAESLADKLIATGLCSSNNLRVFNVYLAPNNEKANGYIADVLVAPNVPSHPIKLLYEHVALLQHELKQSSWKQFIRTHDDLTHSEVWALFRLSGYTGSSSFQGVEENVIQLLLKNGLVRELQKEEAIQLNERLLSTHSMLFGPKPRSRMRILSDTGRDILYRILDAMPSLKQHLMASRIVGEYVQHYFPSLDSAIEAQTKLKESGKSVTTIELIGRWCYYWWDVHSDGARLSYWDGEM